MAWDILKKVFKKKEVAPQQPAQQATVASDKDKTLPVPAAQAVKDKPKPEEDLRKLSDAELESKLNEELGGLPKEVLAHMKNPEIRTKIMDMAKKMIKAGVDIRSERQIKNWIKGHPEEAQAPAQPAEAAKPEPFRRPAPKVNRNDLCPCGSGKKYKKCCEAKETK